jgi:caffeoyl-CoA O-methyltransferase
MNLLSEDLEKYIHQWAAPEDEVLKELTRETHLKVQMPQMLSGYLQGSFMTMFTALQQPKRVLEIGTFTGYSAICFAKGMSEDSLLYTLDINEELAPMCQRYFEKAGVADRIKMITGKALEIIPTVDETFDLIFIDADKHNYINYYDAVFDKVRPGGWIIADNVLWSGKVVNEQKDKDTQAIHAYNEKVAQDPRVKNFILPLRDGLNIAQKLV